MFEANKSLLNLGRGSVQPKKTGEANKQAHKNRPDDTPEAKEVLMWREQNKEKISKFIDKVKEGYNGAILPDVHYEKGDYAYPALKEIGEDVANTDFMENLSDGNLGLLERFVYNRFLVCPQHSSSFLVNVRLFCPKCSSISVEKLHLLEHRSCGYLAEKTKFVDSGSENLKCPSCSKGIKAPQKEMRVPAVWYFCDDCKEKFDEVSVRLHCKEYDHDFTVAEAGSVTIYGYALANSEGNAAIDYPKLRGDTAKLLSEFEFSVEENYAVRGKSGNEHVIDVYGVNKKKQSVFVLINSFVERDSVDSRIIQILDTMPSIAILAGYPTITETTKSIASKYNASIIASQNVPEILSEIKKILSQRLNLGVATAR